MPLTTLSLPAMAPGELPKLSPSLLGWGQLTCPAPSWQSLQDSSGPAAWDAEVSLSSARCARLWARRMGASRLSRGWRGAPDNWHIIQSPGSGQPARKAGAGARLWAVPTSLRRPGVPGGSGQRRASEEAGAEPTRGGQAGGPEGMCHCASATQPCTGWGLRAGVGSSHSKNM